MTTTSDREDTSPISPNHEARSELQLVVSGRADTHQTTTNISCDPQISTIKGVWHHQFEDEMKPRVSAI